MRNEVLLLHWFCDDKFHVTLQATIPGFLSRGISLSEAETLMKRSVELALETRDTFWNCKTELEDFQPPLVAASIGSYGAYLADGSEYRYIHSPSINALTNIAYIQFLSVFIYCYSGIYGPEMTLEKLKDFHRRRIQLLAEAGPDLLAFETTPNKLEAQVSLPSHDSLCYSGCDESI